MIDQLTVFLNNTPGRLTAMCRAIGDAHIQMHALSLADSTDFGVVRIICDNPEKAALALSESGFSAGVTKVVAAEVPDVPGGLARVFGALDAADINIEYSYCFGAGHGTAAVVMKVDEGAIAALEGAGFKVLHPSDLYK